MRAREALIRCQRTSLTESSLVTYPIRSLLREDNHVAGTYDRENEDMGHETYIFQSISILHSLIWKKYLDISIIFCCVSQNGRSSHCFISSMYKYHNLVKKERKNIVRSLRAQDMIGSHDNMGIICPVSLSGDRALDKRVY